MHHVGVAGSGTCLPPGASARTGPPAPRASARRAYPVEGRQLSSLYPVHRRWRETPATVARCDLRPAAADSARALTCSLAGRRDVARRPSLSEVRCGGSVLATYADSSEAPDPFRHGCQPLIGSSSVTGRPRSQRMRDSPRIPARQADVVAMHARLAPGLTHPARFESAGSGLPSSAGSPGRPCSAALGRRPRQPTRGLPASGALEQAVPIRVRRRQAGAGIIRGPDEPAAGSPDTPEEERSPEAASPVL